MRGGRALQIHAAASGVDANDVDINVAATISGGRLSGSII